jgi:hypothetical protein
VQKAWECLHSQLRLVLPARGPRQWAATPATLPGLTTPGPCQIHWAACRSNLRSEAGIVPSFPSSAARRCDQVELPVVPDFICHLARMCSIATTGPPQEAILCFEGQVADGHEQDDVSQKAEPGLPGGN